MQAGNRDVEVEIRTASSTGATARWRALLQDKEGDDLTPGAVWSFDGAFLEQLLAETLVYPGTGPGYTDKKELLFSGVSPGTVLITAVQQSQGRGCLAGVTYDFTATHDSSGVAWASTLTNLTFSPSTSDLALAQKLVELKVVEFRMTADRVLQAFNPDSQGVDRSTGGTPLRFSEVANLSGRGSRRESSKSPDSGTAVLAKGAAGFYGQATDATALANRGRRVEVAVDAGQISTESGVTAAAQAHMAVKKVGQSSYQYNVAIGEGLPAPDLDFKVADYAQCLVGNVFTRRRISQYVLTFDHDKTACTVALNDLIPDPLVRLAKALLAIGDGGAVVGTSTAAPGQEEDTTTPNPPTGITVASSPWQDGIAAVASVLVGWTAPTTNTDGSVYNDAGDFLVQVAYDAQPGVWHTITSAPPNAVSAVFDATQGVGLTVRVAAADVNGHYSAWSTEVHHVTEKDATPPPVPSTLTVEDFLRQLIVRWNGLGSAGETMPIDFISGGRLDLYVSTSASVATDAAAGTITPFDSMTSAGGRVFGDAVYGTTYYFCAIAVDQVGNRSAPSAVTSAVTGRAIADDIGDTIISAAKLAAGAVTGPKIAAEAVSTPHLTVAAFAESAMPNGAFEDISLVDATKPAMWSTDINTGGTHTWIRDAAPANARSGSASAKLSLSAASGTLSIGSEPIPTKPGDVWFVEVSARASRAVNALQVQLGVGASDPPNGGFPTLVSGQALTTSYPDTPFGFNYVVPATIGGQVPKFLRLFLKAGQVSGDDAALDVWLDEVRLRKVVGTAEIADAAISRAKIGLLAVGDAQVEVLAAGKVTTGTFTGTYVIGGEFVTATSGQRMRITSDGWTAVNGGGTTFAQLSISGGFLLVTGEYNSGLSGERIRILQDGTLRFMGAAGTSFSEFANMYGQVAWRGVLDANGRSGRFTVGAEGASMHFASVAEAAPPFNMRSEIALFDRYAKVIAPLIELKVDGRRTSPDGFERRVLIKQSDSSGNDIGGSTMHWVYVTSGSGPAWLAVQRDSGIKFGNSSDNNTIGNGRVYITDAAGGAFRALQCSTLFQDSSEKGKADVAPITATLAQERALDVVRAVRAKSWLRRPSPGEPPPADARPEFGLIAEELRDVAPDLVDGANTPGGKLAIAPMAIAAMAWEGVKENDEDLAALTAKVDALIVKLRTVELLRTLNL